MKKDKAINSTFVTYAMAKALKRKGFDEPCLTYYYESSSGKPRLNQDPSAALFTFNNTQLSMCDVPEYTKKISRISAPSYLQAIDWFREKHNIVIYVKKDWFDGAALGYCGIVDCDAGFVETKTNKDYYVALCDAIIQALKEIK